MISQQRTNEMAKKQKKIVKVFIVDDSAVLRERLITILSDLKGIEIIGQAKGPLEAQEAIPNLNPDVVILDIRMPGGNGIDVLENIKKGKSPPIVIMFTNYPYPQYRKKYMDAGADFFFDKSTEFDKIFEILKKLTQ
jgi:DNA-binding NarL/FixJ family response regulator